jgi:hypothetical protein
MDANRCEAAFSDRVKRLRCGLEVVRVEAFREAGIDVLEHLPALFVPALSGARL